jgi:hypothetical protein
MPMEQTHCQACKLAPVEENVESDEPQSPFQVCRTCAHRLQTLSLRPLEWYNLASVHGPCHYYLHDDFYDHDGTAYQSDEGVVDAELFPAPTLVQVAHDLEQLLDYATTRWFIEDAVVKALNHHSKDSVLISLQRRVASNPVLQTKAVAFEICARVLGMVAEDFIRKQWESYTPALLQALAEASAACLPSKEGFNLVEKAVANVPPKEIVKASVALSWFRSEATLDWIERNISDPLVENWGRLAAVSDLKWERVDRWLASGRPLSLVALDALIACWHYNTVILRRFAPKLLEPAPVDEMTAALNAYLDRDSAPRVRKAIAAIVGNWDQICNSRLDILYTQAQNTLNEPPAV